MTQIYSDEEFVYRLSKSLNDITDGRTMDAETLQKNMKHHAEKSSLVS